MSDISINSGAVQGQPVYDYAKTEAQAIRVATLLVLFGTCFVNQTHIETDDQVKLIGKLELIVRLACTGMAGLLGAYGLLFVPKIRMAFLGFPGIFVTGIACCYVMGTILSPYPMYSLPYLITFTSILLFAPFAFHTLGTKLFFGVILFALWLSIFLSWFLYLAMPEFGVMVEITDASGNNRVERMAGSSHPNVLAGMCVLLSVTTAYLWFENKVSMFLCIPAMMLCALTVMLTGTRVAAVAAVFSIAVVYRHFWLRREIIPFAAAGVGLALLAGLIVFSDDSEGLFSSSLLKSTTRSGSLDEITSVTGRAEIWVYVCEKIMERPIQGYGPGVVKFYLFEKQHLLHTHNVVLNMAFLGGLFGGLFAILMFLSQLYISIRGRYRLAALISIVVIINSLTENPIFDYIPGTTTVLWLGAIFWPDLDDGSL